MKLAELTVNAAIASGYKLPKAVRYCKLGESFRMIRSDGDVVLVCIMSTGDMQALGLRFTYERFGQWGRA